MNSKPKVFWIEESKDDKPSLAWREDSISRHVFDLPKFIEYSSYNFVITALRRISMARGAHGKTTREAKYAKEILKNLGDKIDNDVDTSYRNGDQA